MFNQCGEYGHVSISHSSGGYYIGLDHCFACGRSLLSNKGPTFPEVLLKFDWDLFEELVLRLKKNQDVVFKMDLQGFMSAFLPVMKQLAPDDFEQVREWWKKVLDKQRLLSSRFGKIKSLGKANPPC